ncbi:hypothetical protein VCV18_012268 [Metarhizium anisopliae]
MSLQVEQTDRGVCPITLARKLALIRIDQESKRNGVKQVYDRVLDDFKIALTGRKSHEEAVHIISHYVTGLGAVESGKR